MNNLIRLLPAGTAYFIGIVLVTMLTGQLVRHQGSLARAALGRAPALGLASGRARDGTRQALPLDTLFDSALTWRVEQLPAEPVRLGSQQCTVHAINSSTIARLRASARCALLGKGYCHRAGRSVRANVVAALSSVVLITGVRVGLVRCTRFGQSSEEAVAHLFAALPDSLEPRLFSVDAGVASREQFEQATAQDALCGRLRQNVSLRRAPRPRRRGQRGRPRLHGPVLHPGAKRPEGKPEEDTTLIGKGREVRVRRWHNLHFARPQDGARRGAGG